MRLCPKRTIAGLAFGFLALATAGCSFRVVMPPPPPSEWPRAQVRGTPEERCTSSITPPVIDTAAGTLLAGLAVLERNARTEITPIALGAAALPAFASAIYGFIMTAECRRYQGRFNAP